MKISPLTIYIIGASFFVAIVSFGFFMKYLPNSQEAEMYQQNLEALQAEANKLPKAEKRREEALQMVADTSAKWRQVVATKTPSNNVNTGGISLAVNAWQLSVDTRKFRNNVQRLLNTQLRKGGVEVVNGPYIPGIEDNVRASDILASYYNYPALPFPVVIYDLGQVTVRGTYEQITAHVRAYSSMPQFLAVADGLAITGTSPNLTGTYNLQLVGFIRGNNIFPGLPEGAGGGQGGAQGGMMGMGGPPMGMMGPGGPGRGAPGMPGGGGPSMSGMQGAGGAAAPGEN